MTIYEKIENKGILDAEQIISNGLAKADSVQVAAIEAATVQLQATFAKTTEKNEHQLKTKTTEFEQSAKQEILTSKKALIEEVLNLALIKMKQLSDVQWKTLVIQTLSGDELNGNETIVASSADQKRFLAHFATDQTAKYPVKLDLLNKALSGKDFSLTLSKKVSPVDGGFFVDGADFDIDHSYVTILSTLRDRYESELASILFDGRN
jgi:vacuolar-type H+-ATPase subunit E/Vma4